MKNKEDYLNLLRKINKRPQVSQRDLAKELGFSTGKLNYCLKSLIDKGLVKIQSFRKTQTSSIIFMSSPQKVLLKKLNLQLIL